MNIFLTFAYLFFIGSVLGWVLELFFRRFFSSANPERKWINPGFCVGPYLPLYGTGLCVLYTLAKLGTDIGFMDSWWEKLILLLIMAVSMTLVEFMAGLIALKWLKVRYWDYRNQWGNVMGIICPKFSLAWGLVCALYLYLIHPNVLEALKWLSENLAFSFVIGIFFGVFTVDAVHSAQLAARIRAFAKEEKVVVVYESLKAYIKSAEDRLHSKTNFFKPFSEKLRSLPEYMRELVEKEKTRIKDIRGKDKKENVN